MLKRVIFGISLLIVSINPGYAQITNAELAGNLNVLARATPFVNISPHPPIQAAGSIRSVNINPNNSGHFLNPAITAGTDDKLSIAAAYTPWMRELIQGASLLGLSVIERISEKQAISADFTYFRFRIPIVTPISGSDINAKEIIGSFGYSRILGHNSSGGIRIKYINSNLTDNQPVGGVESRPGRSLAVDLGYNLSLPGFKDKVRHKLGVGINNLGTKISYSKDSEKDFIPTSVNLGYALEYQLNGKHKISLGYEVEKLLIPTPPVYYPDSLDIRHDKVIQYGYDPNVSVLKGVFQSFYDAPGGFSEELHELIHHFGMDYSNKWFNVSSGIVLEHSTKGNAKYASFGFGISLWKLHLNTFYLLPFIRNSYLSNTLGFSLGIDI